jgi:hypothetical protein
MLNKEVACVPERTRFPIATFTPSRAFDHVFFIADAAFNMYPVSPQRPTSSEHP